MFGKSTYVSLFATLAVTGCSEHDYIYGQITQHNNQYTASGISDSGSEPATSLASSGSTGVDDSDDGGTTQEPGTTGEPETTGEAASLALELRTTTNKLERAGSVLLELDVTGEPTSLFLYVHGGTTEKISWPIGQDSFEYIIDTPQRNGTIEFQVIGQDDVHPPAVDSVSVLVALPGSGTVHQRIVGAPTTAATAIVVAEGEWSQPDDVYVISTDDDDKLKIYHRYVSVSSKDGTGELWELPVEDAPPMKVTAATMLDGRTIAVGGGADGTGMVRLYHYENAWWQLRSTFTVEQAVIHDVVAGPLGWIWVAGARVFSDHTDAAAWVLDEDGAEAAHATYEAQANNNGPINSALYSVAFDGERVIWAGESEVDTANMNFPPRAALFELDGSGLHPVAVHALPLDEERSGWRDVAFGSEGGFAAVGWYHHTDDPEPRMAQARFTSNYTQYGYSTTNLVGNAIDWHPSDVAVIGGSHNNGRLFFDAQGWPFYLDPELGAVHDIAIDRHGYTHMVGELTIDETSHTVLLTVNP